MAKFNFTDDIFFSSISDLSASLRKKEFSTVELTHAFCDRLEKLGARYHALALSLRDTALRKAKDVDRDFKIDRIRSPLQGIPYGAKDLLAVKGKPTTWGTKAFAGQVFKEDAQVIESARQSRRGPHRKIVDGGTGRRRRESVPLGVGHRRVRESMGSHVLERRIVEWAGDSYGGGVGHVLDRLGNIGIDPWTERLLRDHRLAAHLRTGQPPRRDGSRLDAR